MAENGGILGIHMTKFGKHKDKDTLDLGAEAVFGALDDAGVTMRDVGVLGAGNLLGSPGYGQQLQKQIGQTGIPVDNVGNACATGATALRVAIMAIKAGGTGMGAGGGPARPAGAPALRGACVRSRAGATAGGRAVGVEKLSGAGLLTGNASR